MVIIKKKLREEFWDEKNKQRMAEEQKFSRISLGREK